MSADDAADTVVWSGDLCPATGRWQLASFPAETAMVVAGRPMPRFKNFSVCWVLHQAGAGIAVPETDRNAAR